jgi:RNA-directed DNA polymerase
VSISPPLPAAVLSPLALLKTATDRRLIAYLLGTSPKALAYILYKKPLKYVGFNIPKRSGGTRQIWAPTDDLKHLQANLAALLQECEAEANPGRRFASHGFRKEHDIATNAKNHRNKRFVFTVDIEDFFESFNFGRVRGYFLKNKYFQLTPHAATTLAQIACHNGKLPQGAPCSPVITNLIGQILDVRLTQLAKKYNCWYSRYADDLTFSTNEPQFPAALAVAGGPGQWTPAVELQGILKKAGFGLNGKKTRMQYRNSRQEVTGLTVNRRLNTRLEYRHNVRAMVHQLVTTGSFVVTAMKLDPKTSLYAPIQVPGLRKSLKGMLGHIEAIDRKHRKLQLEGGQMQPTTALSARQKTFKRLLMYTEFFSTQLPVLVCEGETDNIYLKGAISRLSATHPKLALPSVKSSLDFKVRFHNYSGISERILALSGGTSQLATFIVSYSKAVAKFFSPAATEPLILLIDNDSGAKAIFSAIKTAANLSTTPDGTHPWYHVVRNLYVVVTPKGSSGGDTKIEDFFDSSVTATMLGGKTFNSKNKGLDPSKEYGKVVFAHKVIKPNIATLNFAKFAPILKSIEDVIDDYHAKFLANTTSGVPAPSAPAGSVASSTAGSKGGASVSSPLTPKSTPPTP